MHTQEESSARAPALVGAAVVGAPALGRAASSSRSAHVARRWTACEEPAARDAHSILDAAPALDLLRRRQLLATASKTAAAASTSTKQSEEVGDA